MQTFLVSVTPCVFKENVGQGHVIKLIIGTADILK